METGRGRGKFNQPSPFPVCAQRGIAEPFSLRRPSGGRRRKADNRQPAPALWYGRRRSGSHRHQSNGTQHGGAVKTTIDAVAAVFTQYSWHSTGVWFVVGADKSPELAHVYRPIFPFPISIVV